MDKNNLSKKVGLLLAGCFITFNALGQTTIKGQVVDATGEPVISASILVKDKTIIPDYFAKLLC